MKDFKEIQKNAEEFSKEIKNNGGRAYKQSFQTEQHATLRNKLAADVETVVESYRSLRKGDKDNAPIMMNFGDFIKETYGFETTPKGGFDQYLLALGINPKHHSIQHLTSMSDARKAGIWLVPEVITEAVRLGMEANSLANLITGVKSITSPTLDVPHINMADSMPKRMGEAERFSRGSISYGNKQVTSEKIGMGISISDEVRKYTSIDLLAAELEDVGRWINIGKNAFLIEVLLNGEQASGDYAAPTVGVGTIGSFAYKDLKRVITRMKNLQRAPQSMLSSEDTEIDISLLPEIVGLLGGVQLLGLNPQKSDPRVLNTYSHGLMSEDQLMMIDNRASVQQLSVAPLAIENERDASRQVNNLYISETLGYYKLKRDASVILDKSLDFAANGFPEYMNLAKFQLNKFK